jgi:hypothetical protein
MSLTSEAKKEIFASFGGSETNTGSTEAQIAMFTKRIADLRVQWFDAQSTMNQISNQAGARFTEAEAAAADVFARITDSRAALTDTFGSFAQEIKANSKTEDN